MNFKAAKPASVLPFCLRLKFRRAFFLLLLCLLVLAGSGLTERRLSVAQAPAGPARTQRIIKPDPVPQGLTAGEWSSIRQQCEQHRHRVEAVGGVYQARNPGQQFLTRFDGRGFLTSPDAGGWQWGLELRSYGYPEQERRLVSPANVTSTGQRVTYDWDDVLQEWFVNDQRGLEHGFTVRGRPQMPRSNQRKDAQKPLTLTLGVRGGLSPETRAGGRDVRFVDAEGMAKLTYSGLTVRDADGRELPARFEAANNAQCSLRRAKDGPPCQESLLHLAIDDDNARYPITIDPIVQQAYVKASNPDAGDYFGWSVAVSGNTIVIGAPYEAGSTTGVNGNQSDNSALLAGAAYVFVRSGTLWSQQAYLKASNSGAGDYFGYSVAVSGDTIVVGAPWEDSSGTGVNGNEGDNNASSSGAAYVFVRSGTSWGQQAYLKASNTGMSDQFGLSVGISGVTIVIGAPGESSSATGVNGDQSDNGASLAGAAYVFVRSDTNWSQQAYLKASNTGANDRFGRSVAISGDTTVVGADYEASSANGVNGDQSNNGASLAGAAYVFTRNGTTWSQQSYLKASNTQSGDYFGSSVMISGDTIVVGAPYESSSAIGVNGNQTNNSAFQAGAAYVFVRNGTSWSQEGYLKASNTAPGDYFGRSVAVSGDTIVVGEYGEDSSATGVNGNESDNSAVDAGAAYVFVRSGTNWSQQAYLKASNTAANDWFGYSVAVSGDTIVVGAYGEDSNATGVNGNQSNNSADRAGAAYEFAGVAKPLTLAIAPDGEAGYFLRWRGIPDTIYYLLRAPSANGPYVTNATLVAPASGDILYQDTSPLTGCGFYRVQVK